MTSYTQVHARSMFTGPNMLSLCSFGNNSNKIMQLTKRLADVLDDGATTQTGQSFKLCKKILRTLYNTKNVNVAAY